jgi:hypothetical protein
MTDGTKAWRKLGESLEKAWRNGRKLGESWEKAWRKLARFFYTASDPVLKADAH